MVDVGSPRGAVPVSAFRECGPQRRWIGAQDIDVPKRTHGRTLVQLGDLEALHQDDRLIRQGYDLGERILREQHRSSMSAAASPQAGRIADQEAEAPDIDGPLGKRRDRNLDAPTKRVVVVHATSDERRSRAATSSGDDITNR
jgi:hypothetical protein